MPEMHVPGAGYGVVWPVAIVVPPGQSMPLREAFENNEERVKMAQVRGGEDDGE